MRVRRRDGGISLREYTDLRFADVERRIVERGVDMERRLAALNELRSEVVADRGLLVRREFLDQRLQSMDAAYEVQRLADLAAIARIGDELRAIQQQSANLQGRFWALGVGLTVVVVLVNVAISFIK